MVQLTPSRQNVPWRPSGPPSRARPGLRVAQNSGCYGGPPAPASTSPAPLHSESALWLIPDGMRFVSKELRVVHPCGPVVWVSQALPRRLTVGTGSRAPPRGLGKSRFGLSSALSPQTPDA